MADLNLNNQTFISDPTDLIFYGIKSDGAGGFDDWKIAYADLASGIFPSANQGEILYYSGSAWVSLGVGTDGNILTTHGAGAAPTWAANSGGDVYKVGTPSDNELGVWTGDGTIEGVSELLWDGTDLDITGNIVISGTVDGIDIATDVAANTAKTSNVSTSLSTGTRTTTSYGITSDGGADDIVLLEANISQAGLLGSAKWSEIVANTLKTTNATHTGDVTGSVALSIAGGAVDLAHLSATGTPSTTTFLRGDYTWGTPSGLGDVSKVGIPLDNQVGVWTGDGTIEGDSDLTFDGSNLTVGGNIVVGGTVDGIDIATDVAANTLKVTNATHTGDVTGSTELTIASGAVDLAMLSATGTPSVANFLSGNNTWRDVDAYENGIYKDGVTDVKLGGLLTEGTVIGSNTNDYNFSVIIADSILFFDSQNTSGGYARFQASTSSTPFVSMSLQNTSNFVSSVLISTTDGSIQLTDAIGSFGARYTADYSTAGEASDLWIPSWGSVKAYADSAGGGDVTKVGTPLDNQVGVWTGDGTIEGDSDLTFDGSNLTVGGNIIVGGTVDGIDIATDVAANTLKVTNATHTGDVTGSGALTIASGAVDLAMLSATGTPSATTYLSGAWTWNSTAGIVIYKTAASGLPSTTGAGDVDFSRVNDYYSETAITGNVTWGITNISADRIISIDMKTGVYSATLVESGITFKGAVNGSGVIQGLSSTKSNLIMLWAETTTIVWVNVILNEA